jgi:Rod binding domain-containing protein
MDSTIQSYADMAMSQAASAASVPAAPPPAGLAKLHNGGADIDKTSQDFESMFMTQMLQPMFEGLGADPTFGGGHGEEIMRSFMIEEYGKIIGKKGLLGISTAVKTEMIRAQAQRDEAKANSMTKRGAYANHP